MKLEEAKGITWHFLMSYSRFTFIRNKDETKDILWNVTSSNILTQLCEKHGTIHETAAPYTSEQNGIVERKIRTSKEKMDAM